MRRHTFTDNIISIAIAIIIGLLVISAAESARTPKHTIHDIIKQEKLPTWEKIPESEIVSDTVNLSNPCEQTLASDDYANDVRLIAAVVHHEAENQPFYGKRLVAAVVLNRIESDTFPATAEGVVYQKNQFFSESVMNATLPTITDDDVNAVMCEIMERSDTEIMYFCSQGYGYGIPAYKYADHYFSK